jgi:hypothetical protein
MSIYNSLNRKPQERRYVTYDGREENALDKAARLRARAVQIGPYAYQVKSSRAGHEPHVIEVTASGLVCDCEAGFSGNPCFHAATVAKRLWRERKPVVRHPEPDFGDGELFDEDGYAEASPVVAPQPQPQARPKVTLESLYL